MKIKQNCLVPLLFTGLISLQGCSQLIEVNMPKNQLTATAVFEDSISAEAALLNIYYLLGNQINSNLNRNIGLYTDELSFIGTTADQLEFYRSNLSPSNGNNGQVWNNFYHIIYSANDILERIPQSTGLSEVAKANLSGEARFMRAYAYYYLQNLYTHIPLVLQTGVEINSQLRQSDSSTVYQKITEDLREAKEQLLNGPDTKTRATTWSASSLLARIYLHQGKWREAGEESTVVINSGKYLLDEPATVFLANSSEAILQIWTQNGFVSDASQLIPSNPNTVPRYAISTALYTSFEQGDSRLGAWINKNTIDGNDYHYLFKYKNRSANPSDPEYLMVLRLAEQYLIRAEALARQGKIVEAVVDLNTIRKRSGLEPLQKEMTREECLAHIIHERRVELFGEWGHRFLDLKRSGNLSQYMAAYKATWQTGRSECFPLPQTEINYNPFLVQNPEY